MTTAVKNYLLQCPALQAITDDLATDLTDQQTKYALLNNGSTILKTYRGAEKRQANFALSFLGYSFSDAERLENCGFCEKLIAWITTQNLDRNLPVLPAGYKALSITADSGALVFYDNTADSGIYQVQIHLVYIKEANI